MTRIARDVRTASNADGTVVLHLSRGTMFHINPTGAMILGLLERGMSLQQIATHLSSHFSVSIEIATADLSDFIASLRFRQLIDPGAEEF